MKTLYIICGKPFSGKSTLSKYLKKKLNAHLIGLDAINIERGIDPSQTIPLEEWENTHHIALSRIDDLAQSGENIILDDTNLLKKLRKRFREKAMKVGYKSIVIFLNINNDELFRRYEQNIISPKRNSIPLNDFKKVLKNFENPTPDENVILYYGEDIDRWYRENFI